MNFLFLTMSTRSYKMNNNPFETKAIKLNNTTNSYLLM